MPKLGMEPIRRKALIEATIRAIHSEGYCKVTIHAIAREAGVSTGLAHHYFGSKEHLLAATMRSLYRDLGADVRMELARARSPRARVSAILIANLSRRQFSPEIVSAWLAFYTQARSAPAARHLLNLYYRRMQSNLAHALGGMMPLDEARALARDIGALIDGYYLRQGLEEPEPRRGAGRATCSDVASAVTGAETPIARIEALVTRMTGLEPTA